MEERGNDGLTVYGKGKLSHPFDFCLELFIVDDKVLKKSANESDLACVRLIVSITGYPMLCMIADIFWAANFLVSFVSQLAF